MQARKLHRNQSTNRLLRLVTLLKVRRLAVLFPLVAAAEIPESLPGTDGKAADNDKPVKVYAMLGQSNMLGFGRVEPKEVKGSLEFLVREKKKYPHLVDTEGKWLAMRSFGTLIADGSPRERSRLAALVVQVNTHSSHDTLV